MKKMTDIRKIIIHSNLSPNFKAGIPMVVSYMLDHFENINLPLDIEIVYGGDEQGKLDTPNTRFRRIFRFMGVDVWTWFGLGLLRKFDKKVLLIFNEPFPSLWPVLLLSRLFNRLDAQNLIVYVHATPELNVGLKWIYKKFRRIMFKKSVILTSNQKLCEELQCDFKNVSVAPLYVRELDSNEIKPDECKRMPLKFVLFFGRIVKYKGTKVLPDIIKRCPNVHFLIAGTGSEVSALERKLMHLSNVTTLFRIISESEKSWMMANCRAFIFPSVNESEAFGITQLEAMRSSKPIINFDLGNGVNDVGRHGVNALSAPISDISLFSDFVNIVFENDEICKSLGSAGRDRAEVLFSKNRFDEVFGEIIDSRL
jgi:glycosyltransferase involved in cell wall biosynthesis